MTKTAAFDPREHRLAESRWFEDFRIGEAFALPSRTITEAHFSAFQAASGDNHPIHYDRPYCRARGHRDLLAHGYHVVILTAAGAGFFPHMVDDSLIAFLDQSSRFLAPVYVGDTVYPRLTVAKLEPQRTTGVLTMTTTVHNQDGSLVLDGTQRYLLRKRPVS
jgi:acyl dehydratase